MIYAHHPRLSDADLGAAIVDAAVRLNPAYLEALRAALRLPVVLVAISADGSRVRLRVPGSDLPDPLELVIEPPWKD